MHKGKHGADPAITELCENKDAQDLLIVPPNLHPIFTPKRYYIYY